MGFTPVIVEGVAVGQAPTRIAQAIMARPCPACAAAAVFRAMSGAMNKRAAVARALKSAGIGGHVCGFAG